MLAPWKKSYDKPKHELKSRDITLLTKIHVVKAMVFPVVKHNVRVGPEKRLKAKEFMSSNYRVGEDS